MGLRLRAFLILVLSSLLIAGGTEKINEIKNTDAYQLCFWVFILILLALNIIYAVSNRFHEFKKAKSIYLSLFSSMALYGFLFFIYSSVKNLGPEGTMVISLLLPVVLFSLSSVLTKEKITADKTVFFIISVIGVIFILYVRGISFDITDGLYGLGAVASWSIYSFTAYRTRQKASVTIYFGVLMAALLSLILVIINSQLVIPETRTAVFLVATSGVMILLMFFWINGIKSANISFAATVCYMSVLALMLYSLFFRGYELSALEITGASLLVLSSGYRIIKN